MSTNEWNVLIGGNDKRVTGKPFPTFSKRYLQLITGHLSLEEVQEQIRKELNERTT